MRFAIIGYFALVLAVGVLVGTGLVVDFERVYSDSLGYRWQTQALLEGRVAIAHYPEALRWDFAWANGAVQQVWGLGVPLWQLPFEAMTQWTGLGPFPDRFAFGIAMMTVFLFVIVVFVLPRGGEGIGRYWKRCPETFCLAFLLMLFPPFLTLCRTRFLIYEEAVAYTYLAGVALLAGTVVFCRKPRFGLCLTLCLMAGLAPFIRPTLVFYGVATAVIVLAFTRIRGWPLGKSAFGALFFAIGILLLLVSNHYRFGSALEFGHTINLNGVAPMRFATRFESPFASESLSAAGTELVSGLFVAGNRFNGFASFEEDFFPGQAATHRWRELYFTTFDLSYALMLTVAWGARGWMTLRRLTKKDTDWETRRHRPAKVPVEVNVLLAWSAMAAVGLFVFYLRIPVMSSRYLVDFGPAFAAGLGAFVYLAAGFVRRRGHSETRVAGVLCAVFLVWWGWQIGTAGVHDDLRGGGSLMTSEQVAQRAIPIPGEQEARHERNRYRIGDQVESGWPSLHLDGWNLTTGQTTAAVALFVPALERLTLEVAPAEGAELTAEDFEIIRAKVGLEFLERVEMTETPEGMRLVFAGPRRSLYREGVQVGFLGFMTAEELHDGDSRFRLLRVGWKEVKSQK